MHLLVDQADFLLYRLRLIAQDLAQDVEIALDHGDRVVDLVATCRQFADGGELRWSRVGAAPCAGRRLPRPTPASASVTLRSSSSAQLQFVAFLRQHIEQPVEFLANRPSSSPLPVSPTRAHHRPGRCWRSSRPSGRSGADPRAHFSDQAAPIRLIAAKTATIIASVFSFGVPERRLEKADIEHADAFSETVEHGFVTGHIEIVPDEGGIQPGIAATEHEIAYLLRHPRPQRALLTEQAHVGRDARVAEEERRRPLAAEGQRTIAIYDRVDRIDETRLPLSSVPPSSTPTVRPVSSRTGAAAWMSMPRLSVVRASGAACAVGTILMAARSASDGSIASSAAAS